MNPELILTERRNKVQTAAEGRADAVKNTILSENPEHIPRLASVSEKVRQASGNLVEPIFRGRIKVIRTRLPSDFFAKPDSQRGDSLSKTPDCRKKQQKIDPPSFSEKLDGEAHLKYEVATERKPYFENKQTELNSLNSIQVQQTANFFFSSSQSTCDVDNSSIPAPDANIQKFERPKALRKNSKSKAEYKNGQYLQESLTSRGATAVSISRPPALPLGNFKNLLDYISDDHTSNNHFGGTFSIHKKFYSTPTSPRFGKESPLKQTNIEQIQQQIPISRRVSIVDERPRLIRQRFGSKNKKASEKFMQQDKIVQNLWKQPILTNKKGPFLPPLHAK